MVFLEIVFFLVDILYLCYTVVPGVISLLLVYHGLAWTM